jgi:hypothetical protein
VREYVVANRTARATLFRSAEPFPHVVIANFLFEDLFLFTDFPAFEKE